METRGNKISIEDTREMLNKLNSSVVGESFEMENKDGFLKTVLKDFFSKKNISMKTEYLNVYENYIGTKLQFLGMKLDMPYMEDFLEIFEVKRVSLERKGRKEILMLGKEIEKEDREQKLNDFRGMFGL